MANLRVRDGENKPQVLKAGGDGTEGSPLVPIHDVNIQDQTTPVIIRPFHNTTFETTLAVATAKEDRVVNVVDGSGFLVGDLLSLWNIAGGRWYQARVLAIVVNAITVDTPLDFEYQIGDQVAGGLTNMNVNGLVTPQIFKIRAPDPGIPVIGDITRIIMIMETNTKPAWNEFGDLAALTNGLVLRKTDGVYQNIANVKTNSEFAAIMYDFEIFDVAATGQEGAKGRLTFAGQNKMGVTIRLGIGDDLEIIVQDDLTGISRFTVLAQGHVVSP